MTLGSEQLQMLINIRDCPAWRLLRKAFSLLIAPDFLDKLED